MRRHNLTALLLALLLTLAVPGGAMARAEIAGVSGLGCCVDLGVRLSLSLEGSSIRGSVALPGVDTGVRSTGSPEGGSCSDSRSTPPTSSSGEYRSSVPSRRWP